ncbi:hypothetical protein [Streptomyces sp. NPDC047042]|uniref:hypothetical protein n=1 Tax=Streptomyces sp. NPDC047042 TaxID=3154807 RepID=UPI0033F24CE8
MSVPPRYRALLPDRPPTPSDLTERAEFERLIDDSLPRVQDSAEKWRNGLAAFITLVTTGFVIKGRDVVGDMPVGWGIAITTLVALGLAASVIGLWQALAAQAGGRWLTLTLADVHERYGSVRALRVAAARRAGARLDVARAAVAVGLVCLLAGVGLTWWAPAPTPAASPPSYLKVEHGSTTTCGVLRSADGGMLRLTVTGRHIAAVIPMAQVSNLSVVAACG